MATPTDQLVLKEGNVFLVSQGNGDISGNTALDQTRSTTLLDLANATPEWMQAPMPQ
jgi:hypothetical protein